jgi:hypothetical protein
MWGGVVLVFQNVGGGRGSRQYLSTQRCITSDGNIGAMSDLSA